ncbi:TIGR02679 family protein [Sporolactobacillus spathodeae]|uniref:Uncharacterized protein (TIGR02679 family) n=1 Tax=Sporolactobacillus spathodeae TaxID=1465502 RepID=A0ABS2QA13_9BACL|nr:TIGR02679 family protein [Sporolactobacillus spathodeae]MBM7658637.1 uncharacterized protein (TIGR02679 family) [Sporolactobacillus spathodeae]
MTTNEAALYFRARSVFAKLFRQAKKTYHTYGELKGTFSIGELTAAEKSQLALFLSKPLYEWEKKQRLRWSLFETAYQSSKFVDTPLLAAMEQTLGQPFTTKIQDTANEAAKQRIFLEKLAALPHLRFMASLEAARQLYEWYTEDPAACMAGFSLINHALDQLPKEPTRLPFFAHQLTGDPHALDPSNRIGKAFIAVLERKRETNGAFLSRTEYTTDVLLDFNLVRDDIMNFVAINGLLAKTDDAVHPMWQAAVDTGVSWNVPVRHLLTVASVLPAFGRSVYLIENSGVYSALLDARPDLPLVCTNGQLRLAVWMLLDKLAASGALLYYSGDFDPEGVQMADQILKRYPDQVRLWAMSAADYIESNPRLPMNGHRMNKLKTIESQALHDLVIQMAAKKKAGYQEAVYSRLLAEVRQTNGM